ncbi:MAG: hypothetical protein KDB07_12155, partial [Planctomycetes bacterium]|nr:hypothetical protein [Planctomycetota bacterium]
FKLKDYSKDGVVSLEAYDTYWGGAPSIKTLVFRQVQEAQTRVEKLTGDEPCVVDDVARSEWEKLGDKVHKWWALNCCYLGINTKSGGKALQDFRIRKAIQLAMDREALAALYLGTAQPSYTLLPPTFAETDKKFRPADTEMPLEERIARAKVLIQESGINGDDLKVTLKFPQNPRPYLPEPSKTAERVKQQLAKVGIQVEPESVPNSVLFSSFDNEQHQMVLLGWMSDNADPDNYFGPLTGATMREGKMVANSNNVGRTTDDKVNDAIRAARSLTDSGARAKAYQAIEADQQERLIGYVPLVNTQQGIAISSKLKGVEIDKLGHYRFHKASIAD